MAEKLTFVHSPTHTLPDLEKVKAAKQNPAHPFYVGADVKGRNAAKIAVASSEGRKSKATKKK